MKLKHILYEVTKITDRRTKAAMRSNKEIDRRMKAGTFGIEIELDPKSYIKAEGSKDTPKTALIEDCNKLISKYFKSKVSERYE